MTQYEIERGLEARGATKRIDRFRRLCARSDVLSLEPDVVSRAAQIYGHLSREGLIIQDADILIAATALHHGLVVATNNTRHFERIEGLDNWSKGSEV